MERELSPSPNLSLEFVDDLNRSDANASERFLYAKLAVSAS